MITVPFRSTATWPQVSGRYREVIDREFAGEDLPIVRLEVGSECSFQVRCPRRFARRVIRALEREFYRSEVAA